MKIKQWLADFKSSPATKLTELQSERPIWLVMMGAALLLLLTAMLYFQRFLEMDPCEICVFIRFSQSCIIVAGLIIIIDPKNDILKFLGIVLAWWAIIQGFMWGYELLHIHIAAHMEVNPSMDFFAAAGSAAGDACSMNPVFPLHLPVNEWFPFEFNPTGGCGEDDWSLFGLIMAQWCMVAYGIFGICGAALTFGWIRKFFVK